MGDLSTKSCCVYDYGNYPFTAQRLAREFGKVYYFKPWKDTLPVTQNIIVGKGYPEFTRVRNFFDIVDKVDLFVFPDIYDGDLQLDLVRRGKRVWGSRMAEDYEYRRGVFCDTLREVGLAVAPYKECVGVTELREYLTERDDQWVKVEMRGDRETWHHENIAISTPILDAIAYYYGPVKEDVSFYVFESIDTDVEASYDGYMVSSRDGKPQFPDAAFLSYETKNQASILHCVDYNSLSDPVHMVNDRFGPLLAKRNLRSQFGTEIKVAGDNEEDVFFLDATCRQPSPPGEMLCEMVLNWGEIMWHGSEGDLVEPEIAKPFGAQVILYSNWAGTNHLPVEVPSDIAQWVKLGDCYKKDGLDWVVPREVADPIQGWRKNCGAVIALGDSIQEAIDTVIERCDMVKSFDTDAQVVALGECLKRIHHGEEEGIMFGTKDIPEPSTVLES